MLLAAKICGCFVVLSVLCLFVIKRIVIPNLSNDAKFGIFVLRQYPWWIILQGLWVILDIPAAIYLIIWFFFLR